MKHPLFPRLIGSGLALTLLLPSSLSLALTTEQAGALLNEYYIDPVPQNVLEQPTVDAMVEALGDPYTSYFDPAEYQLFQNSMLDSSITGIGIGSKAAEGGLLIETVYDHSAAQDGGLQVGDLLIKADDHSLVGIPAETAASYLRGEEGTQVVITYLRDGVSHTVTLTRSKVIIPATTFRLMDDHIGYIRCTTFGPETVDHFKEAMTAMKDQVDVWMVDLRGNSGGHLNAASDTASLFAGSGTNVYLRDGQGNYTGFASWEDSLTLFPVIVLTDGGSASASEIFAASIRDREAGIVIGSRTLGKGVAQTVLDQDSHPDYFADGDALKITTYRFFSPYGNTPDQIGVVPDLLVPAESALDVARLFSSSYPTDIKGKLRLDMTWRWYLDPARAASPDTLLTLFRCLPAYALLYEGGIEGSSDWKAVSNEDAAAHLGLSFTSHAFTDEEDTRFPRAVDVLYSFGMIDGYEDGTFRPQGEVTRAELCQMLASALGCFVPKQASPFTDVPEDAWYKPAVTAMYQLGLVNGVGEGRFDPEGTLDHQQFFTIMGRTAAWLNMNFYQTRKDMAADAAELPTLAAYSAWSKPDVWLLAYGQTNLLGEHISILWADPGKILPEAPTTREEAAYTLHRLLSSSKILPM